MSAIMCLTLFEYYILINKHDFCFICYKTNKQKEAPYGKEKAFRFSGQY